MQTAPFFNDLAGGPSDGAAWWVTTSDGVRLRVGVWNRSGPKGTVLLFPGRTEYIEKYGTTAADLAKAGFATMSIDWRGQGLAKRLAPNPLAGHVEKFSDYQRDVTTLMNTASALNLPQPYYLIAHSMGGAIGYCALQDGLPVKAAVFSGPLWGLELTPFMRIFAPVAAWLGCQIGLARSIAPSTPKQPYVLSEAFESNTLTHDAEQYQRMIDHLHAQPELALAGPTYRWVQQAFITIKEQRKGPIPNIPCLTILGSEESIISSEKAKQRMNNWPKGHLEVFPGGHHEVLMEIPEMRIKATQMIIDHFLAHN